MSRFPPLTATPVNVSEYWRNIAASRLQVKPSDLEWKFQNLAVDGDNGMLITANAGGNRANTTAKALRLSSGGGAGGQLILTCGGSLTGTIFPKALLNGASQKWWIAAEFSVNTTIGAGSRVGISCWTNAAQQLTMGGDGSASIARFFMKGTANIDSGVNLDTNFRVHEGWRDGTNTFYTPSSPFDTTAANPARVTPVSGTTQPSADCTPGMEASDTAAVLQTGDFRWFAFGTPR